jgi:hypothetical protein
VDSVHEPSEAQKMPNDDTEQLLREYLLRRKKTDRLVRECVRAVWQGGCLGMVLFVLIVIILAIIGAATQH